MSSRLRLAGWLLLGAGSAAAAAPAPAPAPEVQVRVEKVAYPVHQASPPAQYSYLKTNPNLAGQETYTTDAIVLENEFVRAVVLPEFGARLPRVFFKPAGRDLFWVHDVLEDNLPWSMGGIRFSFPFCEHGRHMDESAGWRIVKAADGSVTVAMDMRFCQYAGEVERYGRFSALRQATFVTLRPQSSAVEYAARIDNRLPLPHGFRLWSVAHFLRRAGAEVLLPAGAVTDQGASAMHPWPVWDDTDHSRLGSWGTSCFGIDMQGDWAGVYYPDADANHLVLKPRFTAPGTRFCAAALPSGPDAAAGRGDPMIEIGSGSNPIFEHPGDYLPPFGAYVLPLRLAMAAGIGRVDWANEAVAVSYERLDRGGRIRAVGFQVRPACTLMARTNQETVRVTGALRPDRPLVLDLTKRADTVLLTVVEGEDTELAEVRLPWKPDPTPEERFTALRKSLAPWNALAMELSDWPRGHAPNIAEAARTLATSLAPGKAGPILQAARLVLRTETPGSDRWKVVRSHLGALLAREPKLRNGHAYMAMMMILETGGKVMPEASKHLAQAGKLPAVQYLLGLDALGTGNLTGSLARLASAASQAPPVTMGVGEDALEGSDRLHPAALPGGEWPTLVRAAVLVALERPEPAIAGLDQMLTVDPARPEALALLAEAYTKAKQSGKADQARADAERLFQGNDPARRDYEALLREARMGLWSGIPRP